MGCPIHRILTFTEAMQFPEVTIIGDAEEDVTKLYAYSWSTDGVCWSGWVQYDQYRILAKNMDTDFYLRVLISGSLVEVRVNGLVTTCYSIAVQPTMFGEFACDNPNLFNPYANLDCALLLQQQLADSVVCLFGIPVYYFRVDPDKETKDYTFKEYVMHSVVDCKQIKLMVQDGQMPSSNPRLTELDFDWETDWETELSKTQFARAFGDNVFPKAKDFLYVPMMRRMWEVNAAYDEKNEGLLWRSTTWKLSLVKYADSTNVSESIFDDVIDNLLNNKYYKNVFGDNEVLEAERQSGAAQVEAPRFAATNLYNIFMEDATRQALTREDVVVLDKIYCHHNNIVARNIYKFKNANGCVVYQKGMCGESGVVSMIIETPGHLEGDVAKDIAEFGPVVFEAGYDAQKSLFKLGVGGLIVDLVPFSTYLVVFRWSRATHTQELYIYKHIHRTDFPVYLLKPEQFWFDLENPISVIGQYNPDFVVSQERPCQIYPWPLQVTNVKLYNGELSLEEAVKESLKYTTTSESCVLADLARPIDSGRGFDVK